LERRPILQKILSGIGVRNTKSVRQSLPVFGFHLNPPTWLLVPSSVSLTVPFIPVLHLNVVCPWTAALIMHTLPWLRISAASRMQ
jgi:hypothetical protein